MKTIENVLNWHTSETGLKYRVIEFRHTIIRGIVHSEEENYRVIFEAYKHGKTISSEASTFKTIIEPELIYKNLESVYNRLTINKPPFERFLSESI